MRRWDLTLVVALVLVTIGAAGLDWRLGAVVAGVSLGGVWFWLGEEGE